MLDVLHPDAAIARIASRQHGVVSLEQLRALGLGRGAIQLRVRQGRLHSLYRGVFLVGHTVRPPLAREMGAVLAYGDGAILSHRSAVELWGLLPPAGREVDVTVPGRLLRSRRGIRVHTSTPLDPRDHRKRYEIPVTTVPRTLLDFGETGAPREFERAYDEARTQRLVAGRQLVELLARSPGRHGAAPLGALLARDSGPALTQSEAEERMLALIRRAGLPEPEVNVRIGRWQLDFFWREQRLNVEVDGYRYHSREKAIGRNHERDADLEARGIRVRRVTWRQLVDAPEAVVARIARAL